MAKRFRITTIIIIAVLIFHSIAGCGAKNTVSQSNNDGLTLTIAARDGSHTDIINAAKERFEKENNCTLNVIPLSGDEIYSNVINNSQNGVSEYDIVMIDDPLMPEYIEKGVLTNLTQLGYMDDEDFVEKSRLLGKDPYPLGATYALPFSGNVQLIFYNHDLISDISSFDNWNQILSICNSLHENGKKGYAIRGQSGNPIVSDFLPILWSFGGDLFDDNNNVILDSPQSIEALEFYCKLLETGDNYDKDGLVRSICDGEAGIALGWPSWFVSGSNATAGISQIPGKKDESSNALATGEIGNWLLGVTANSANPELALKCITYLTSADVQKSTLQYGCVPTRTSVFRDDAILKQYPFFEAIYMGTNNSRVRPRTTKWSQIETVFGEELVKCIEKEQSVEDTIKNSQEKIEALYKE